MSNARPQRLNETDKPVINFGIADDFHKLIIPQNTTANLALITPKEVGSLAYDTTLDTVVVQTGSGFSPISAVTHINQGAKVSPSSQGTNSQISFSSADTVYDQNSFVGTNQLIAQRTGLHLIDIVGQFNDYQHIDHTGTDWMYLLCAVNGGSQIHMASCTGSNINASFYASGSTMVNLTAGDVITFFAQSQTGAQIVNSYISLTEIGVS